MTLAKELGRLPVELAALVSETAGRAAPVFRAAGWQWAVKDGKRVDPYVPDELDIAASLTRSMHAVLEHEGERCVRAGRFVVAREIDYPYVVYGISLKLGDHWQDTREGER